MKLYHGSQEENFVPTFGLGNDGHDYGRGFYLTEFPELSKEWAVAADSHRNGWMHAYDVSYRNEIVETQGRLFGRIARENPDCDGEDFITSYMKSDLRSRIDRAEARPANMTAVELKENFVRNGGYAFKPGKPIDGLSADWIGQFYAYAQWQWGIPSAELVNRIPIRTMRIVYPGLHDLDLPLAVERAEKWQVRGAAVANGSST